MKYIYLIACLFFILPLQAQKDVHNPQKPAPITAEDYKSSLDIFSSNEKLDEAVLGKSLTTAQTYLMQQNDKDGLLAMYDIVADYAQRTNQTKEYIDMKSNKAQMLISNGRSQDAVDLLDSIISHKAVVGNLKMRCLKARGDAYRDLENHEKVEENYNESLEMAIAANDTFYIGMCYISLAGAEQEFGNVYNAIDLNIKAMNILDSKKRNNAYLIVGASHVLSNIFMDLDNNEKALEYATVMEKISKERDYKKMYAYSQLALGKQAMIREDWEKAKTYYTKAKDYFGAKKINLYGTDHATIVYRLNSDLVEVHQESGNMSDANKMINYNDENEPLELKSSSLVYFNLVKTNVALAQNQLHKVKEVLRTVDKLDEEDLELKTRRNIAKIKAKISEAEGSYKSAYTYNQLVHALNDSLDSNNKSQLVHNLEAKYQKAEKEAEISKLSIENQVVGSKLKQRNKLITAGGIGLAILSFLLFQLNKLNQKNKKNKEQLAEQNAIITSALADKNTLLKEIHHRVKNNLQVISSLLSLQSRYVKDEGTLDAIKAGKSRVQSMSLLHQNLYRDDNLKGVEMKQYFTNLGQNLFDTYKIEDNIQFTTDIEDITLDIDTVVPIGLITNELVSNSLKHAFKGRENGTIHLSLKEENKRLILSIKDNGIGLPDAELPVSSKSLGATLIQSFTDKLEGDITIDNSNGSAITIEISDYQRVG